MSWGFPVVLDSLTGPLFFNTLVNIVMSKYMTYSGVQSHDKTLLGGEMVTIVISWFVSGMC